MDYSVGSLADLISGSNTPNKPKVIKQEFKQSNEAVDTTFKDSNTKRSKNASIKLKQEGIKSIKTEKKLIKNEIKLSPTTKRVEKLKKRKIESDLTSESNSPPKKKKVNQNEENAERRVKKKIKEIKKIENPEALARTIFVGNIPIACNKKKIKKHFKKYGPIETLRIRGIAAADPKTTKRVAAIKKEFNPNRSNAFCYIRFEDKESALEAEAENGALFQEHHLRVHTCASTDKPDETRAIFIGNLSFNAVEDELWKLFESCGPISYVRIIRDSHTGMGKGFAYVNFKDSDAVQLALEMENVKLNDRELRISLCNLNTARKNKKFNKKKQITQSAKPKLRNTFNKPPKNVGEDGPQNRVKQIKTEFQGAKFTDKKKKHKVNKGLLEKKKLVKSIAPKPK